MDEFPGLFGGPAFLDDAACTACNALCAAYVLDPDPNPLCDNCLNDRSETTGETEQMTTDDKILATALRDLCGPAIGMVYTVEPSHSGYHVMADEDDVKFHHDAIGWLPVLDASANRGHWLTWLVHKVEPTEVSVFGGDPGWSMSVSPCATCEPERFADALLRAYMEHCEAQGTDQDQHPSVRAWWEKNRS